MNFTIELLDIESRERELVLVEAYLKGFMMLRDRMNVQQKLTIVANGDGKAIAIDVLALITKQFPKGETKYDTVLVEESASPRQVNAKMVIHYVVSSFPDPESQPSLYDEVQKYVKLLAQDQLQEQSQKANTKVATKKNQETSQQNQNEIANYERPPAQQQGQSRQINQVGQQETSKDKKQSNKAFVDSKNHDEFQPGKQGKKNADQVRQKGQKNDEFASDPFETGSNDFHLLSDNKAYQSRQEKIVQQERQRNQKDGGFQVGQNQEQAHQNMEHSRGEGDSASEDSQRRPKNLKKYQRQEEKPNGKQRQQEQYWEGEGSRCVDLQNNRYILSEVEFQRLNSGIVKTRGQKRRNH